MNIVLLTHYFPPIGGPGARRMLGWVNGFVASGNTTSGNTVTVVTPEAHPRDPYYQPEEQYDGPAKVLRPAILDPARLARGGASLTETPTKSAPEQRGLAAKLRPWLLLPDQRRLGNGPLVRAACDVVAGPTLVLTSSPYNSVHLAGRSLKQRFGERVTWVADFRDDWFHPVFFPHPNAIYRAYNRRLERAVLRDADGLTVVSRRTLDRVRERHTKQFEDDFWRTDDASKWRWMPNGFDPTGAEDILNEPVPERAPGAPVRLLFSGTLWQGHSLVALVAALDAVAARTGQTFDFELAGRVIEPVPEPKDPARVRVSLAGWKPYEESLAATRRADLLLVHTGPESQDIKIKIFDAAAVRRPVLVLGPTDSATVRLVEEHVREPLVADQTDQMAIEQAVERYLQSEETSRFAFTGIPEEYDRLKQAARLLDWATGLSDRGSTQR